MDETMERRLTAAEESALFAERAAERLTEELGEANRTIVELERRLSLLETRFSELDAAKPGAIDAEAETRPPHAAGPRPEEV